MMNKVWSILRSLLRSWGDFWGFYCHKLLNREQMPLSAPKRNSKVLNESQESSSRLGVITSLENTSGVIDFDISFDSKAAGDIFDNLITGCTVEYVSIQRNGYDVPTVVKVLSIRDVAPPLKRAIKVTPMNINLGEPTEPLKPTLSSGECPSISLIGKTHFVTQLHKDTRISLILRNNEKHTLHLKGVTVPKVGEPQLSALLPRVPTDIRSEAEILFTFLVLPKFTGETSENIEMDFDHFKVRHSIAIIVYETEEETLNAQKRMLLADVSQTPARKLMQMYRFNAKEVCSRTREVVPGQCVGVKRRFVPFRLGTFEVPEKLRQIYLTIDRQGDMFRAIELQYPIIKEPLSMKSYTEVFGLVLHLEDIEHVVLARKYDRERAQFQHRGEYLSLRVENLAERRPSLVMGDVVHAICINTSAADNGESKKIYEGIIHRVLHSQILLKFNTFFQRTYNGEEYRLEFHFSRFNLRKQHHAILKAVTRMGEAFLFPTKVTKRAAPQLDVRMDGEDDDLYHYDSKLRWFNPSLNPIQKQAVLNIMRGEAENMPYVIFGPPGTGKTMTLVEAILQLANNLRMPRILVGTPSNSSADMITRRIIQSKVLPNGEFVRLVSFNQIEKNLIPPDLVSHCATVDIGSSGTNPTSMVVTESGLKMRCHWEFLGRHRVTISTTSGLGTFMQSDLPADHFTHVFIDEAGQCTEPETMVPISLLRQYSGQAVLAGDPRQLQAVVVNRYSNHRRHSRSFLERLLNRPPYEKDLQKFPNTSGYNPMCLTKLLNNYRALPSIMVTYSKLFYDDELIPMVSDTDSREIQVLQRAMQVFRHVKDVPTDQGAFFFGINGENLQDDDSPSWYNPQEAREVYMTTCALYRCNIEPHQIGILTPYTKQAKTIRNAFTVTKVDAPKIGSVEEFQGQERDVMLISLVRSVDRSMDRYEAQLALGFVKSEKRMNVAISRARAMMVVFGNPKILIMDDLWRSYITYCANNNAIFGCKLEGSNVYFGEKDASWAAN